MTLFASENSVLRKRIEEYEKYIRKLEGRVQVLEAPSREQENAASESTLVPIGFPEGSLEFEVPENGISSATVARVDGSGNPPEPLSTPEKRTVVSKKKKKKKKNKTKPKGNERSSDVEDKEKKAKVSDEGKAVSDEGKADKDNKHGNISSGKKGEEKKEEWKKTGANARGTNKSAPVVSAAKREKPIPRVTVIGDSQAGGLQPLLSCRLRTKVGVICLPGRGNRDVRIAAERARATESSVVALMVSGNDLYLRSGRLGSTDAITRQVMSAVDDCGLKTRRRVVVGMIPRLNSTRIFLEKNEMVNKRLRDLCTAEGVFFVDPFRHFSGRRDLYRRDGVHLSLKGMATLCNLLEDVVRRTRRSVPPGKLVPRTYQPVTPETSFTEVVKKGGKPPTPQPKKSGNGRV